MVYFQISSWRPRLLLVKYTQVDYNKFEVENNKYTRSDYNKFEIINNKKNKKKPKSQILKKYDLKQII